MIFDPLRRLTGRPKPSSGDDSPVLSPYRTRGADAGIVFVHGFGSGGNPFAPFADLLAAEPALGGWDLYGLAYNTGFLPDLRGVWPSDPSISLLATYLRSRARLKPLADHDALALVAHSMGGLVVQRALVEDDQLADRASHVFCFGTPSGGVPAARWGGFLKQQVGDMVEGGPFISELRDQWEQQFGRVRPFELWVVAGDRDGFVPASSSLEPFPSERQVVVPGDHLEIIHLDGPGSMSQQVVVEGLLGKAAPAGPWNSARVAVEQHEFDRAVRELLPHASELDEQHLVDLALALEGTGRRQEALALLREQAGKHGTDAKGTLAGRLKRDWLVDGRRADGDAAIELYSEGLRAAIDEGDHEQAYYHAINVAFLELAYRDDREAAKEAARLALDHARPAPAGYWRSATEGEAHLYRGERGAAFDAYAKAVSLGPAVRELESTYAQASEVAGRLGAPDLQVQLDAIFRQQAASTKVAG